MGKIVILLFASFLLSTFASADIWDSLDDDVTIAVGDEAEDVGAALEISLLLSQRGASVNTVTYEDYVLDDGIIVTSGEIEAEFLPVFEACDIDVDRADVVLTSCSVSGHDIVILYQSDPNEIMSYSRNVVRQNNPSQTVTYVSTPRVRANVSVPVNVSLNVSLNVSPNITINELKDINTTETVVAPLETTTTVDVQEAEEPSFFVRVWLAVVHWFSRN